MQKKYGDLHRLMQEDKRAKDYFDSLPEYVREAVSQRPQGVNSLEEKRLMRISTKN